MNDTVIHSFAAAPSSPFDEGCEDEASLNPVFAPDDLMIEIEWVSDERPAAQDLDWQALRQSCDELSAGHVLLTKEELTPKERRQQLRKNSEELPAKP